LLLLAVLLLLWAAGGHAFYRIDRWHDERDFPALLELIAHKAALAGAIPGLRLLVAGGSNAYYGIDSDVLEDALNVPVVNVALPFGAHHHRIYLAILSQLVRPGDLVLYASSRFWVRVDGVTHMAAWFDAQLAQAGLLPYRRQFETEGLPWKARPARNTLLLAGLDLFRNRPVRPWTADTDAKGDYTGCVPVAALAPQRYGGGVLDTDHFAAVRAAAATFEARGARLLVSLPTMLIHESDRLRWMGFRARLLREHLSDVPAIATEPDLVLRSERAEFCDTPFHLAARAARERSERLAIALRAHVVRHATGVTASAEALRP